MSYQVSFTHIGDVRMGSPFNTARLILEGGYVPKFDKDFTFQDKFLLSDGGKSVYLVRWEFTKSNEPGFIVIYVDGQEKSFRESQWVSGCCEQLFFQGERLLAFVFENQEKKIVEIRL